MEHTFNIVQFRTDGENFLNQLMAEAESVGLPISCFQSDHLCFRVETLEQYSIYKRNLEKEGHLLTEAMVNGRPIATYQLKGPFKIRNQTVNLVELPAPKPGTEYKLGFEHAEFVISDSFDAFASRFPALSFVKSGAKNLNPELCVKLPSGQIKFHHLSLARVIEIEDAPLTDIIFDLDGTLIESREAIYEINRIVFSQALQREVTLEESKAKFHSEFSQLFTAFELSCPQLQNQAISTWSETSENFKYPLFKGIAALLENLSQGPFKLHLWTARDENSARTILKNHDLEDIFATLSFSNPLNSKPSPENLRFDWETAKSHSTLVIGDSSSDIMGAKNIGAIRVGALWDKNAQEMNLISAGAEMIFHEVRDFADWLNAKA